VTAFDAWREVLPMPVGRKPLSDEQLTAIEDAFAACTANPVAAEGPVLIAEIRRQRAELSATRQALRVQDQQMARLRTEMTGGTR